MREGEDVLMKWQTIFHGFIRRLYYSRITVTRVDRVPARGPLMVLCLHRNGAVDGFIYREAVPRLNFLVRAKLSQGLIGKLFFAGVEVIRRSDGGHRSDHHAMVETCVRLLQAGNTLAVFPEGTSKLGPQHLPFQSGAAHIALGFLENDLPLTVLPLGIHYECPWSFRSRVEVVVGAPIKLEPLTREQSRRAQLQAIKLRFSNALEAVGFNVPDEQTLDLAQKFAYIATLGTDHRYFDALKSMEQRLPPKALEAWERLETKWRDHWCVLRHQGVPLFAPRLAWLYALLALLLAIPVLAGAVCNGLPLAIAYFAGRRFADDTNVIALWRILTGVPAFILWVAVSVLIFVALGNGWVSLVYLGITWFALRGWYRLKKLTVAAWNGLFHADLRTEALALHQLILDEIELTPQRLTEL